MEDNKTIKCNFCGRDEPIPPDDSGFELSGKTIEGEYYCEECFENVERHGLLTVQVMKGERSNG